MPAIKKHIVFLLFCALLFSACKEKDCHKDGSCAEDYRRLRLSDEAKSYLWADTGSWWIYKNTKTGELDTQTVTYFKFDSAISKGHYDYSKHITLEYDVLSREIYSTYHDWLIKDEITGYDADATTFKGLTFGLLRYVSGVGDNACFYIPFDYPGTPYCQYLGLDSSIVVQNKTYKMVVHFSLELDPIWKNSPPYTGSTYYWAKSVGVIKRVATHKTDNWELIDYQIN